ncbi:MAG TPA: Ig-like domain-containing protein [Anaeromyxobacter sp.]
MAHRSIVPHPRALLLAPLALLAAAACDKPTRVEMEPSALRFGVRGQTAKVHATPIAKNGKQAPDHVCAWSSTNEAVAKVSGPHNDGTVTATGPGNAAIRCSIGDVRGEVPVSVRVVAKVTVGPEHAALKVTDEPAPFALAVAVFDDAGAPVQGRVAMSRCADENVCRGDGRAQLWAVAAGETTAFVEVEGARSADIKVSVVDARTAAGKPQRVTGNPMEAIEREVRKREAEERKKAGK